jgi:PIN domain nuclease of toxin-antitoxin system
MKLLLDTHIFLWLVEGSPNLSSPAESALTDPRNDLVLSSASVWELAIKVGNGKLQLSEPVDAFVWEWTAMYQIELLPIFPAHALAVAGLPNHHRDPFGRMLAAQAKIEGMSLITADANLTPFGVPIIW